VCARVNVRALLNEPLDHRGLARVCRAHERRRAVQVWRIDFHACLQIACRAAQVAQGRARVQAFRAEFLVHLHTHTPLFFVIRAANEVPNARVAEIRSFQKVVFLVRGVKFRVRKEQKRHRGKKQAPKSFKVRFDEPHGAEKGDCASQANLEPARDDGVGGLCVRCAVVELVESVKGASVQQPVEPVKARVQHEVKKAQLFHLGFHARSSSDPREAGAHAQERQHKTFQGALKPCFERVRAVLRERESVVCTHDDVLHHFFFVFPFIFLFFYFCGFCARVYSAWQCVHM